jgi:glycosyltransferase involved in cell wall biosynthesis
MQGAKDKFLLTIGLPVYEDSEALLRTIESLVAELSNFPDSVEVVVSDNHSSIDPTNEFSNALSGFPNSVVVRQVSNLGFAGNLKALSHLARGTYIWFIGAGDTLVPGSLPGILDVLRGEDVSWGTVMGLFNYHRHEEYREPKVVNVFGTSQADSNVAVFNHSVSLNIMKSDIIREFMSCQSHSIEYPKIAPKRFAGLRKVTVENELCHWPHLEALGQYVANRSEEDFRWFEYLRKSVLLNSNRTGNWDQGAAAMRIFAQWSEVVSFATKALPVSKWLEKLDGELRGWHLLRFTFMLRQDSTLGRREILTHQRKMDTNWLVRFAVWIICWLPAFAISALVWARRNFWRQSPSYQKSR